MKRAGKCIGKKAFRFKDDAIALAKVWYLRKRIKYGVYECPSCLDFHLTSKYCNLKHHHKKWRKEITNWTKEETIAYQRKLELRYIRRALKFWLTPLLLSPYMQLWFKIDHYEKLWKSHNRGS